jgi:anti-anti-sigma factor
VHIDGEMTVYSCGALKPQLLAQLTKHPDATELDLSRVIEIDTAGLQVLLTARRHARESGRDLSVRNPSRAVTEVLELCRLGTLLAAPAEGAPAEAAPR